MSTSATPQTATTTTWNIDPVHSVAELKVKHMMISNVKGQFTRLNGTCLWTRPISRIRVSRPRSKQLPSPRVMISAMGI